MSNETLAFDSAFMIKYDLERALSQRIPLLMLTYSQALFGVLIRAKYTTENLLIIEAAAAREAYNANKIDNTNIIKSEHNLADGLTKVEPDDALNTLMKTHKLAHPVEQYIIEC